jgi:hypothetical protein
MTKSTLWLNGPKHSPSDVDGKYVELDIYEKSSGFRAKGIGHMHVQYHPKTSGLFCIWVAYVWSGEEIEMAMDDIDEDQLRPHPDPTTKVDFICDAKYA